MKKSIVLMLVLFCSVAPVAFAEQQFAIQSIVGTYEGSVFSGNAMYPVLTSFSLDESGTISGRYVIDEEDGLENGTLIKFRFESQYSVSMMWNDKYGQGILRVIFSGDYSSFVGFWGNDKISTSLPWNGIKQQRML